jgi:ankyrin repeat protein
VTHAHKTLKGRRRFALALAVAAVAWPGAGPAGAETDDLRLVHAVRSQDATLARQLIEEGINVDARQGDGATALHWAAHRDDLATSELLLAAGVTVNVANDLGATPLQVACATRSGPMVERLLTAGADPNARLLNGETALMTCAQTGDRHAVRALLAHGARINEREAGHQQTALMWAAARGHADVVRQLLDAGANPRLRTLTYPQTVVDEQTQRAGREALNYTVLRGGSTALLFAARSGDVDSARALLAAGAEANDSMSDGMSALVLAAHSGHLDVGIALLEHGANPNNIGIGYTALHAAVLRSELDLVESLLAHGAAPDVRLVKGTPLRRQTTDYNLHKTLVGATPYLLAAGFLEPEIMRALAIGRADVGLAMPDGTTALLTAVGLGHRRGSRRGIAPIDVGGVPPSEGEILAAVKAAVDLGVDVNVAAGGETALHVAAVNEHAQIVGFLLDRGADVTARNSNDQTPLEVLQGRLENRQPTAAQDGSAEVSETVQLLRRAAAAH